MHDNKIYLDKTLTETHNLNTKVIIAGAGPIGSMLAIILARSGFLVELFESRPDPRNNNPYLSKSSSVTLSDRAWTALERINVDKQVRELSTPLYNRFHYDVAGKVTQQKIGRDNQALYSISRAKLSEILLNTADHEVNITIHFEQQLTHIDFNSGCASFSYVKLGKRGHKEVDAEFIFAADGALSKIRRLAQDTPRFNYSQHYMKQCYIELTINANKDGSAKLSTSASHHWPRGEILLTAQPNSDNSFSCTLYLNDQGQPSFSSLTNSDTIKDFFEDYFSDVMPLLENPVEDFMNKTANSLYLVSVSPWIINNKVALIGDAAHAMVPFYGQGLNCSFEDCDEIYNLIEFFNGDLTKVLPVYYQARKKNADAISKLSKDYFIEMSRYHQSNDERLERKIIDKFISIKPDLWPLVDELIFFSPEISYFNAREISLKQKEIITEIMKIPDIHLCWQEQYIYQHLETLALKGIVPLFE